MIRPFLQLILLAGTIFSIGCAANKAASPTAGQFPPATVSVANVMRKDVPIFGNWVATLDGYVNANIQPQVSGYLIRQNYTEGSYVHKDDVLFEIDPRPFQAVLDQAKAQIAQAKGQVAQAQAQLELAEINVKRDTPLAQARAIAQSQLDNDLQTRAQAKALVSSSSGSVQAAEAAVEQAELNLGFTKVRSLVNGIAGIASVQIGNLVSQTTVLTAVSQVNPIKVYFPISEQEYMRLTDSIKGKGTVDFIRLGSKVPLQLTLANGNIYPYKGRIVFVDRQVDSQTGTIRVVGAFDNPGNVLRPGQFGRIQTITGMHNGALLIPQRAVTELQGRYQVALVGADNKIKIQNVDVGDRVGEQWIINNGLKPGDRVVSEGTSKVREGAPVNPQPDNSTAEGSK